MGNTFGAFSLLVGICRQFRDGNLAINVERKGKEDKKAYQMHFNLFNWPKRNVDEFWRECWGIIWKLDTNENCGD